MPTAGPDALWPTTEDAVARFVFDASDAIVLILDPEGRIVRFNRYLSELSGYDLDEVRGRDYLRLFLKSDDRETRQVFEETRNTRTQHSNPIVTRDGRVVPVDWHNTPLRSSTGDLIGILAVGHDTSDRTRRVEAERESRNKTRLLASASHDLRQPLQAAKLYLQVLEKKSDAPNETLKKLGRCIQSLGDLLNGLFGISSLETGSIVPHFTLVHLAELLTSLEEEYGPVAREKGLTLDVQRTDLCIESDPSLLHQILQNLLSNALRYTVTGGVTVECLKDGRDVVVRVHDTGPGIADDEQSRVFDDFYRGTNTRDYTEGTGLGLAIVARLAELLNHRLELRSHLGKGSTFEVRAPLVAVAESRAGTVARPSTTTSAVLLAIDDDPSVLDSLSLWLEAIGYEVLGASGIDDGLVRLETSRQVPDAILCDYHLAGIDGLEAIEKIRAATGRRIPAIVLTGDASPRILKLGERHGFRVLNKPVVPEELDRALSESLGSG